MKIKIYNKILLILAVAVLFMCNITYAEESKIIDISNINIEGEPSQWGSTNFGVWSFNIAKPFYLDSTDPSTFKYFDISSYGACFLNTADAEFGNNIVIATAKYTIKDRNWISSLQIIPSKMDGMVQFSPGLPVRVECDGSSISPCFTAPESGKYRIETNIINRGTRLGNMGRIAIIPTGTTMETPDNCTEFNIVNPSSGEHVPYDSGVINLTQGDKVFLKVHSLNGEHDGVDIWGSHKITKLNPDETVNTVYDLSDMAFTKAEGFKFYTADKDSNNFSAIFSAKPEWIKGGTEFTKGVAAPASSWKDGTVTMQAKPYIGWNNDDKYITVKPTEKDLIFSYKPILNGDFKLDISAFNTKQNGITNSGVLSISKINTNTGEATPLNELSITGVEKLENTVFELKAGETLLIRVNKTDVSGDDEFKMSVQLEKIDKNLNVISTVNDNPFTGTENINVGDTVKLNAIMGNYSQKEITVQLFACFYNKDGKMTKLKAMPNKKIASMEKINEIIAVNIEDDIKGGRIEVYAWEDFNIGRAINNMIIIK